MWPGYTWRASKSGFKHERKLTSRSPPIQATLSRGTPSRRAMVLLASPGKTSLQVIPARQSSCVRTKPCGAERILAWWETRLVEPRACDAPGQPRPRRAPAQRGPAQSEPPDIPTRVPSDPARVLPGSALIAPDEDGPDVTAPRDDLRLGRDRPTLANPNTIPRLPDARMPMHGPIAYVRRPTKKMPRIPRFVTFSRCPANWPTAIIPRLGRVGCAC